MKTFTRQMMINAVKTTFPPAEWKQVIEILDTYGTESYENERERVQLDIIKLSKGDLGELSKYTQLAKTDYRDVIYCAEYISEQI